ncbi:MAG TPA: CBS domain-containing protein, partial [bacterium]|nr:CBS domain-containing protein [bacterium]
MNAGITKARVDSLNPRKPLYVEKDATVADVVAMMEQTKSGCILVRDKGALIGTLSERTILRNLIAMHMEFSHTPVTRLMSADTHCLYADDSAEYALNEMTFGGFRNITVLSQVGDPSGILTFEDILDHILAKMHVRIDTEEKKPRSPEKKRAREKQGIDPEDFDRPIGVLDPPAALCVESGSLLKDAVRKMA